MSALVRVFYSKTAWKERFRYLGSERLTTRLESCIFIGVVCALTALIGGLVLAHHAAEAEKAMVRSHWHLEQGTVVNRGPYQGDAANVAYRLAVISYRDSQGHPQTTERLVRWSTQVGENLSVKISDRNVLYIPADLNKPLHDPTLKIDLAPVEASAVTPWILATIFMLIGLPIILYQILVQVGVRRIIARKHTAQAMPA